MKSLDCLWQDLRYTFRTLRRDAGFTIFAVLIVGLGIAGSSTVFSVVNALLLHPLPFRDPGRLVWIANSDAAGLSGQTTQVGYLLDLRERSRSYEELGAYFAFYGVGDNTLTGAGTPERLSGVPVSGNFFQVLGVAPQLGRLFNAEECKWHGRNAVLLSHGLWERRFAGDPGIVGRHLTLNDEPYAVVGVLPASFDFSSVFAPGSHIDLYFPFPLTAETNRWGNTLAMVGRLKPGVTAAGAQAELSILAPQLTKQHPERNDFGGRLVPLEEHVSGKIRPALIVLGCAVGIVMLIVCANLSNLLLARTAARQKEIAIRTALGAGQPRLLRQMITEGLTLSCAGALLGVLLSVAGTRAIAHLDAFSIPLLASVRTDTAALAFTLGMALLTGLIFGLAPAFQIPVARLHDALKDTSRGSTAGKGRRWVRGALVVSEIAFACVLLVGAGLLIRSFLRVLDVNLGFHPEMAAALRVDPGKQYDTGPKQITYFNEVLRRVKEVPGVVSAGLTDVLPLGRNRTWGAGVRGHVYPKGQYPTAFVRVVTDGYIGTMGIPLLAGRDISQRDTLETEPVMLINETMARTLFPGQNPIGQIVNVNRGSKVIGVVGDVHHLSAEQASGMEMYISMRQSGDRMAAELAIRTTRPPAELAPAVRAALKPIAPDLAGNDFRTLETLVDQSVSPRRFVVLLLGGFALFALVLASLGIYAVISYSVSRRTQEVGIRMALGASAARVQRQILLETLGVAGLGMALGANASWLLARALRSFLFGVTSSDPATFCGVLLVLTAVAAVAGYLPARRASRIDPMLALRAD